MKTSNRLLSSLLSLPPSLRSSFHQLSPFCLPKQVRPFHQASTRSAVNPADTPGWTSIVDNPPRIVRTGKRHTAGLIILAIIPITAFCLGTWQVQRLGWKTSLIAKYEDRLIRPPLPLPPHIDIGAIKDFDYRRVTVRGTFRHDQEMLLGPRLHDGTDGFLVITPLQRENGDTVLVNRGWIPKEMAPQQMRADSEALPTGTVTVLGLLRQPWKRNWFTPLNKPAERKWYFPDVGEMATAVGAAPVWIEEVMQMELLEAYRREEKGVPIGRAAEVNLRNNHAQYIFTWYTLSLATAVMFWMVMKKQPSAAVQRVRRNTQW